ncbi:IS256-like element IS2606 family transposase [Mycobacterium ulcerans]|uniref:Mutator family transposase n=1 Tax=Mycobacterium ulcerans (strain Agy99) TaxID=362242 RepID=A0PSI9_MYCUA|nr:IS256-like element IS2606 family transposase [Mycobacterium ulcerans]ABL05308.1 transposase for IS2606 [Mycobacterium ulcerans Agy99]ABL05593.1 transposase for IS2606 [Mycobacterium ulcerans Agy99]ABL06447.1 transposase for IS2606 [Mycobacterium ulcerans Agy99]
MMTKTVVAVQPSQNHEDEAGAVAAIDVPSSRDVDELEVARELVRQAREAGVGLTGPGGLLKAMTKTVIETALDEELSEHLGYDRHDRAGYGSGNSRNGTRSKTVLTDACGSIEIDVPRDRAGTFEPKIVEKRQRRLTDVDEVVLSLYARGLTTGEISAHFAHIYDAAVSKDTVSRITDCVLEEMTAWHTRPLERVYAAVFIDALHVKIRDGQVGPRPVYAAVGVDLAGHRDVLGMWAGEGDGESAKYWLAVLTELKNRGVADIFFLVCDGLKGLPDSVSAVFPDTVVQTCIIHLIRGTFRYAGRQHHTAIARALKPIYTAVNAAAAAEALDAFDTEWGHRYPAAIRLWRTAWNEFIPFLDYDTEIRKVICSTNAIESLNARYRRAIRARGHFPTEQSALKCLYLVTRSLDPTGTGQKRWTMRWKPALNAFAITFADRMPGSETT